MIIDSKRKSHFHLQRDRRSDPTLPLTVIDPSEKAFLERPSVLVNPPVRPEIDAENIRPAANRVMPLPITSTQLKKDRISEYQARYKPVVDSKKPRTRKAFEAEQAEERVNDRPGSTIICLLTVSFARNERKLLKLNMRIRMTKELVEMSISAETFNTNIHRVI